MTEERGKTMDETMNTGMADDAMVIEEAGHGTEETIDTDALVGALAGKAPEEHAEPAQTEPAKEAQSPDDARKEALAKGLGDLMADGWTKADFDVFVKDRQVLDDLNAGKDFMRVAAAFERRRSAAQAIEPPASKKSVPTMRSASAAGVRDSNRIAEMSDKEFDEFSRRARAALMSGKTVTIR